MPAGIPVPGPKGRVIAPKTGFWTMHNIVLSAAVFNVRTATCCYVCSDCCGDSRPQVFIDPDIDSPPEREIVANVTVEDVTGASNDCTGTASWTGDAGAEFECRRRGPVHRHRPRRDRRRGRALPGGRPLRRQPF